MSEFSGVDDVSAGDILLYRTTSLAGWAIRLLDGTEVSHASLCLGDDVGEALAVEGLVERSVGESIAGCPWVAVMRRRPVPGPMAPVLGVARRYLDQGNRYGYEQILLLAGICLTRKLDIDNPLLRRLMRAAMRKAVDLIEHLHGEGKEPMICSEFVFRTYHEAVPGQNDPYSLEILSQADPPQPAVVHPESLLGQLEKAGETVETLPAADAIKSAWPMPDEDLDALIEQYVAEAEGEEAAEPLPAAAPEVSTDELLDTARLLATALAAAGSRRAEIEEAMCGAPPTVAEPAAKTFEEILADFVTPGDLLKSPSLERVGTIEP